MPSSEMTVVVDPQRDLPVMVEPTYTYRPSTVKGRRYYVIAEAPQRRDAQE
jgi:hypothetical protein